MENLSIEKFSPKKAELITLAEKYKSLTIKGVEDKTGYLQVDTARKDLKKHISGIDKTRKALNEDALTFQRAVNKMAKDLVEIVESTKEDLEKKLKDIDEQKEKLKRMELAPVRKAKLVEINIEVEDDFILLMDDTRFNEFYYQKKADYEEAKRIKVEAEAAEERRKLQEAQDKLDADRKALEEEKRIEAAKKQAAEDARLQAERDAKLAADKAEQDKKDALTAAAKEKQDAIDAEQKKAKEAADKAEKEKQDIIAEQKRKDDERIAKEEREAKEEIDRLATEKVEQDKAEKMKKYQNFLKENDADKAILITGEMPADQFVTRKANIFTLYKKVSQIIIS